jgi:hypothetical protein
VKPDEMDFMAAIDEYAKRHGGQAKAAPKEDGAGWLVYVVCPDRKDRNASASGRNPREASENLCLKLKLEVTV